MLTYEAVSSSMFRQTFSGLQRTPTGRALMLMATAATMFGCMAFAAKIASARLTGPQVAMIRMAAGLLPCIVVPRWRRAALQFKRLDLILYRGFFGGIAVMLYFLAIEHTTAGIATLLNYTSPVWSGLLSMLFLGERYEAKVLIPMSLALSGVVLVVHAHAHPGDALGFGRWELAGVFSAMCSGAAITAMRAARRGENSWSVYASFCLLGTIVNAPLAIMHWRTPDATDWAALIATAILAMGAQILMTFSLKWVDAMTVGVISQLAVLVSMTLGALFLHERIGLLAAAGAALTISGVAGVTYVTSLSKPLATAAQLAPEA